MGDGTVNSINDRAIEAMTAVSQMGNRLTNESPERHIIRSLKRTAEQILSDAFIRATDLSFQAMNVSDTFREQAQEPKQ